jgi:hypothetical protein
MTPTQIEVAAKAYWNAGTMVPRWEDESEDQRAIVRYRIKAALDAIDVCTVDHLWQHGDGDGSMGIFLRAGCCFQSLKKMVCERCGKSKYVPW